MIAKIHLLPKLQQDDCHMRGHQAQGVQEGCVETRSDTETSVVPYIGI